ncbi:hypothetical protein OAX35_00100 [Candidatus Pelagibacter ubique]|nr:hypothetical protein [Candidatus Pelagibacter ubique]
MDKKVRSSFTDRESLGHLRLVNRSAINANIKHSKNINKQISHIIQLTKFIKEDRAKIERLNLVLDIKQREVDELNSKQVDLLWNLAKQEKKISELEKFKEQEEREVAHFEKQILDYSNKNKVDN